MSGSAQRHPASYRDPAGFVFEQQGEVYRQVNSSYQPHYEHLMRSGLYQRLIDEKLLIPHQEIKEFLNSDIYRVIKAERIPLISYPYEWCYSQLREAALMTLQIQRISLEYGMTLKDASPYNIQFRSGRPIFIDTLSWEILDENVPWIGYRQFCEMFLAPLALGHYSKQSVNQALLAWPDGIPLSNCSKQLPLKSRFNIDLALHIHLHAKLSSRSNQKPHSPSNYSAEKSKQVVRSLQRSIEKFKLPTRNSHWSTYYDEVALRDQYLADKQRIIGEWLKQIGPMEKALDAGCNTGQFSLSLAEYSKQVIAIDSDERSIDTLYQHVRDSNIVRESNILPLTQDLSNMSPANGLLGTERSSFIDRGPFDLVLSLALIHHLLIGRQVPLNNCVSLFAKLSKRHLILEFVPMQDPWAQMLLSAKSQKSHPYNQELLEEAFHEQFKTIDARPIPETERILFLFERR